MRKKVRNAAPNPAFAFADQYGIRPSWFYRKGHEETRRIIGLEDAATDELVEQGLLDPAIPLTARGRARGWWGWQLINFMERRAAAAREAHAAAIANPNKDQKRKVGRPKKAAS